MLDQPKTLQKVAHRMPGILTVVVIVVIVLFVLGYFGRGRFRA
jgi:flagellar basal body-associated protein FliL